MEASLQTWIRHAALRANNDETSTPREFRPAGAEGSSRSCPCSPLRTMPRRAPPRMEAVGRRSWRRPPRHPPNYRAARAGGRSRHGTSCASLPRPTAPSRPVGLVRFCAAKASTPQPCVTGAFDALTPVKRGPKTVEPNPLMAEMASLQRNNAHLTRCLARAEAIIAVQKKLADLLGIPMAPDGERRQQLRHPVYQKPELLAERPNEVWSWDITKLMGPAKWSYFYLYVILDIFSRRVVGWCVADAETATLFQPLFDDAIEKHNVPPGQLTLHADRGGPMKAKATAFLLADLGVTRSHNRPHTSNDNPFSESHFKTLKYQPRFPRRFGCIEDARSFCRQFFDWYNQDHHQPGIGLMTPDQ